MVYGKGQVGVLIGFIGGLLGCFALLTTQRSAAKVQGFRHMKERVMHESSDLKGFFPTTVAEITEFADCAIAAARDDLKKMLAIAAKNRTFDNTARAFDKIGALFGQTQSVLEALSMVTPVQEIRDAAHQQALKMKAFAVDEFMNPDLYTAFKEYADNYVGKEQLTKTQHYFLTETIAEFEKEGLNLPAAQLNEVKQLKKELSELVSQFDMNIRTDASHITVTEDELAGIDATMLAHLMRNYAGLVIVGCDYPTYTEVMSNCSVAATRKKLFNAFNNRAYPVNESIFAAIRAKRYACAQKLGYASFAAENLDRSMAQDEKTVESFLQQLLNRALPKAADELALLKKYLPDGVKLDDAGRFFQWDVGYVWTQYKKKALAIDENQLAEYFPVEHALKRMLAIYETFFSLEFAQKKAPWLWHDDVILLEVKKKTGELCGYLYLDLYPRENKYSHACCCPLLMRQLRKTDAGVYENVPAVALVIANFPKATAEKPALFKHRDVETFFHEFGHALHCMLGQTELASHSGCSVKWDFVEMPSQMFEEWMANEKILADLSCHYKTGEQIPAELIKRKIALKQADSGRFVTRQAIFSLLSLQCNQAAYQGHSMDQLDEALFTQYCPDLAYDNQIHFYTSFGHLTGYGAKYYSYLWSKVFALDMFYKIQEHGLLNPEIGKKFADTVLGCGGSCDPNEIIENFLQRKPTQDAFLKDLGMQ